MVSHPWRRSPRLRGFDYHTNTGYMITICTHERNRILGSVRDGAMLLSSVGRIVDTEWMRTAEIRTTVVLDVHVVMPSHVHGIVFLQGRNQTSARIDQFVSQTQTMGAVVRGFKAAVTRAVRELGGAGSHLWQRNYHDHVIRNEQELTAYREYIVNNPAKWDLDRYHPDVSRLS